MYRSFPRTFYRRYEELSSRRLSVHCTTRRASSYKHTCHHPPQRWSSAYPCQQLISGIARETIHKGIYFMPSNLFQNCVCEWHRKRVLYCDYIKAPEIKTDPYLIRLIFQQDHNRRDPFTCFHPKDDSCL